MEKLDDSLATVQECFYQFVWIPFVYKKRKKFQTLTKFSTGIFFALFPDLFKMLKGLKVTDESLRWRSTRDFPVDLERELSSEASR